MHKQWATRTSAVAELLLGLNDSGGCVVAGAADRDCAKNTVSGGCEKSRKCCAFFL